MLVAPAEPALVAAAPLLLRDDAPDPPPPEPLAPDPDDVLLDTEPAAAEPLAVVAVALVPVEVVAIVPEADSAVAVAAAELEIVGNETIPLPVGKPNRAAALFALPADGLASCAAAGPEPTTRTRTP